MIALPLIFVMAPFVVIGLMVIFTGKPAK